MYPVHNSTFDLALHRWQDPMERVFTIAAREHLPIATPVIGEVLTIGKERLNTAWWRGLR